MKKSKNMQLVEEYELENPMLIALRMINAQHKGMKIIGTGAYGYVYGHDGLDVVYKLGSVEENQPYLSYVYEVLENGNNNPYLPKIFGVRILNNSEGDNGHVFVVAMEKLTKYKRNKSKEFNLIKKTLSKKKKTQEIIDLEKNANALQKKTIKLLRKSFSRSDKLVYTQWDLHSGNFMLRGEQLVITDPISNG